jgi:hypothetical protein
MRVFETPVDVYGRISVLAHDDAGVGAADELTAVSVILRSFQHCILRCLARLHQLRGVGDAKVLKSLGRSSKGRHYRG